MAFGLAFNKSVGAAGGGSTQNWGRLTNVVSANFSSGYLVVTLPFAPVSVAAISVYYNGQKLRNGFDYSYNSTNRQITTLFADTPNIYDSGNVVFEIDFVYQ